MNLLAEELAQFCDNHRLQEKILISPTRSAGNQLLRSLTKAKRTWTNVYAYTPSLLAKELARAELIAQGFSIATAAEKLTLLEVACEETWIKTPPFDSLTGNSGVLRMLLRDIEELDFAGYTPSKLRSRPLRANRRLVMIAQSWESFQGQLQKHNLVTQPEVFRIAVRQAQKPDHNFSHSLFVVPARSRLPDHESGLLRTASAGRLFTLNCDDFDSLHTRNTNLNYFSAMGEENEVRQIIRTLLNDNIPADTTEILCSNPVYPPLFYSLCINHNLQATFADGVPITLTRPGQVALHYLDWLKADFDSEILVRALQAQIFAVPSQLPESGSRRSVRCASLMRSLRIGRGRQRYFTAFDEHETKIRTKNEPLADNQSDDNITNLDELRALREWTRILLEASPERPARITLAGLAACTLNVLQFASASSDLELAALESIRYVLNEQVNLEGVTLEISAAIDRLRAIVEGIKAGRSNPRPGCMHISSIANGGWSGRPNTFVVGLDADKYPGNSGFASLIPDSDRKEINNSQDLVVFRLASSRIAIERARFRDLIAGLRGKVTVSYATRSVLTDEDQFASASLLDVFRKSNNDSEADYDTLARALGMPCGYISSASVPIDSNEAWLQTLQGWPDRPDLNTQLLQHAFPFLEAGAKAATARQSQEFTPYDGHIQANGDFNYFTNGKVLSASALETLAKCPFKFFLQNALGLELVSPLKEDPLRWLEPMEMGQLIHSVFKQFMQELNQDTLKPVFERDRNLMLDIAEKELSYWKARIPPANSAVFNQARKEVLAACDIFLRDEQEHCKERLPVYFEWTFGGSSRQECDAEYAYIQVLPDLAFRLRGSIDRVDRHLDGSYEIWDYKTGSCRLNQVDRLDQGRQLQHALYSLAFQNLLPDSTISAAGYFYTGIKGYGRRVDCKVETAQVLEILQSLLDLTLNGIFVRTTSEDDCKYCEFVKICGDPAVGVQMTKAKLESTNSENTHLASMRRLRGL